MLCPTPRAQCQGTREAEELLQCSCSMKVPSLQQGSRNRTNGRAEALVVCPRHPCVWSSLPADEAQASPAHPFLGTLRKDTGIPNAEGHSLKARDATAVPLGSEKGDRKAICQPFGEQPGSAGSRKAAHQLAAMLKNRSESPPAYSTYLKTSVTHFGKIKRICPVTASTTSTSLPSSVPAWKGLARWESREVSSTPLPWQPPWPKLSSHAPQFCS